MTDLTKLTITEARDGLAKKEFTATELTKAFLDAIDKANPALNAYVLVTPEHALAQAAESDKRLAKGDERPLEGLPLGNKDLFCTKNIRTTACSNILDDFKPTYESTVGQNLWDAGAGDARQAQQRRVRHGLVQRDQRIRPRHLALEAPRQGREADPTPSSSPAVPRVDRPARLLPTFASAPPPPTPVARSASPPRSPALSGSSRPTAVARAGGSWPSPHRSTRPVRSPRRCGIPQLC